MQLKSLYSIDRSMQADPEVLGKLEVRNWRPAWLGVSLGEGRDTLLNRSVTLMRLDPGATDSARTNFLTAARRLAGGRHESLSTVLDVVEDGDSPYIVLESVGGGTLKQWLTFFPPSQADAFGLAGEISRGLLAARTLQITLTDLNLDVVWVDRSRSADSVHRPRARLLPFQPLESVEPVRNEAELLNALGRVLFAMLAAGREPDSEDPSRLQSIAPGISRGVARFVAQLLRGDGGWTLETAAKRISQLEHGLRRRPLNWLAAGFLIGVAIAYPMFGKSETTGSPVLPSGQPDLETTRSGIAGVGADEEPPADVNSDIQPVSLPSLNSITDFEPLSPGWSEFVRSLSPELQVQAVAVELRRRNPGFDGQMHYVDIQETRVRGLRILTDLIRDVTPLAVLTHLEWVSLAGKSHRSGQLENLGPLQGLRLRQLRAGWTRIRDLTPLAGMPLEVLCVGGTRVEDLSPLKGLPLEELEIWSTTVRDLGPLRDLPQLRILRLTNILATDLTPLADLPLKHLSCKDLHVRDWTPLGNLPLQSVEIDLQTASHRVVLEEIKSLEMINGMSVKELPRVSGN